MDRKNTRRVFARAELLLAIGMLALLGAMTAPGETWPALLQRVMPLLPLVASLAAFAVVLLSSIRVRRSLMPLEQLRDSGNTEPRPRSLAGRLRGARRPKRIRQDAAAALAEVDRIVSTSLDADYILETLMERLGEAVACRAVGLVSLAGNGAGKGDLRLHRRTANGRTAEWHAVKVAASTLAEYAGQPAIVLEAAKAPELLSPLLDSDVRYVTAWPVHGDGGVSGLLCSTHVEKPELQADDLVLARGIADRMAAAISNASWEDKLYRQAHYDALTGLPNRALLRDRLEQAMARADRHGTLAAVLYVDIDRLKEVNGEIGHAAGDQLLKQVAGRINRCRVDTVARVGGDEFVAIVGDLPDEDDACRAIESAVEALQAAIGEPVSVVDREVRLSASIGIAVYPRDSARYDDLLRCADAARCHAWENGGGNHAFYDHAHSLHTSQELAVETDLRQAIAAGQIEVYYQPKVDSRTGQMRGAEALMRWCHPTRGMLRPAEFLSVAEESDLVIDLDRWVLATACYQLKAWHGAGLPQIRVAVNLSARHFESPSLVSFVRETLEATGLSPRLLELEIGEDAVMRDLDKSIATLQSLKALGISLTIDNFGSGHSLLAHLARLPVQTLKLDRRLVQQLEREPAVADIVETTMLLCRELELKVLGKGVETTEQLEALKAVDCRLVQGYLVARSLPASDFAALLAEISGELPSAA